MKLKDILIGALIGAVLTITLMAVMYAGYQLVGLPFVPFDLFNWMTPMLPGPIITFGIDQMLGLLTWLGFDVATTAKLAEQSMAIMIFLAGGVLAGIVFYLILKARQVRAEWMTGLTIGALYGLPQIAISLGFGKSDVHPALAAIWLLVLFALWGLAFSQAYGHYGVVAPASALASSTSAPLPAGQVGAAAMPSSVASSVASSVSAPAMPDDSQWQAQKLDRRRFTIAFGASAAVITVAGVGIGTYLARREAEATTAAMEQTTAHQVDETAHMIFPNANDSVVPVPGTRPEYTPIKDHYKVFLELEPTVIDGSTWRLPITGLVDNPLMLTIDDLRNNYPAQSQYVTLSCISGMVGTTLISTTQWTGVSAQELLAAAKIKPGAQFLNISCGDGYYETVPLDLINSDKRIMFCYAWDGNTLPVDHGFPLRIWIPDRFGMKQPKWITSIEVTDQDKKGYWVERGWDKTAQVKTTSVIDTVAVDDIVHDGDAQRVPLGGIAWGGDRGISKVEVSVDGGSWEPAQLRAPLSETTWVIWRYEWPFQAGEHTFTVRTAEKDGTPQIEEVHPAHPTGATGYHQKKATV